MGFPSWLDFPVPLLNLVIPPSTLLALGLLHKATCNLRIGICNRFSEAGLQPKN